MASAYLTFDLCGLGFVCQNLNVTWAKLFTFLLAGAGIFCWAIFLLGALFMVFSAGQEKYLEKGKKMMIGAAIGLGVIVASYGILRTMYFLLYF